MYLHIGLDKVITTDDIIGIFDLDTSTVSKTTRDYLGLAQKAGNIEDVCTDLPKSFIVCGKKGEKKVYISQLSTQTLTKRAEMGIKQEGKL